ncbi:MAG: TIGR03086 family metal-binding protein [Actinomycetota bacterium]
MSDGDARTGHDEHVRIFRLARGEFARRLDAVAATHHALPTPCPDWDVRTVIDHVLAGDVFAVRVLGGATLEAAIDGLLGADLVGPDVHGDFRRGADAVDAAFAAADPDAIVDHVAGRIPVRDFIEFRTADYSGHAWDLAVATGQDRTLHPDLVASMVERTAARRESTGSLDQYDDADAPPTEDLQTRLLALMGRDADLAL